MNNLQNIVFINPGQIGYRAGYYYYAKYLAIDKNYIVHFLCFDQNLPKLNISNIHVQYINNSGNKYIRHLRWLKSVYNLIKKTQENNTVFFLCYFKGCIIYPILFPQKKIILDIRSGSLSPNALINWFQNKKFKFTSIFFSEITILSLNLMKHIGIKKSHCSYLPLGAEILSSKNKEFKSLNLLYVGTLDGRKIYETIEGIKRFRIKNNSYHISYDIIGYGKKEEVDRITDSIEKNNLNGIIKYHGRKNHFELQPFFDKCNIGVSYIPMTEYYEFQPPTKTFEYILSGMVCIATNTYENRLLISKENGVLCDDNPESFANALENIIEKKNLYDSDKIRKTLQQYTWKNIVDNYLKPVLTKY